MNYTEIEVAGMDGKIQKFIMVEFAPGEFKSFPADEANPEYVAFLASLETTPAE